MKALTINEEPPVAIVVALARGNVIGRDNKMPWHLPEDLRHFRKLTMGGAVIMGRRTRESIGKPLPGRLNIVVSRKTKKIDGYEVAKSPQAALDIARASGKNIFVIGGEQIYRQLLPQTTVIYLTDLREIVVVDDGDAVFPPIDRREWRKTASKQMTDPSKGKFSTYHRRPPRKN